MMGGLLHGPPRSLLAVPNVTAHSLTASVSTSLWTPAQRKRASMLYFANVYLFIYFFMAALFSGPG